MSFYNNHNISACIITNGANLQELDRAVMSVIDVCSEVIICANGNYDSVNVHFHPLSKIKVYEQEWHKDFGKARNECLGYASGEWILIIDSDEELIDRIEYLSNEVDGFLVTICKPVGLGDAESHEHSELRLFRNHIGGHYEGKIHEQPRFERQIKAVYSEIRIRQFPVTAEELEGKFKRNAEILLTDQENSNKYFLMCQTFLVSEETDKLMYAVSKVLESSEYGNDAKAQVCYWAAVHLWERKAQPEDAKQFAAMSIVYEPNQIASRHLLYQILKAQALHDVALSYLMQSMKEINEGRKSKLILDYYLKQSFFETNN